MSLSINAIPKLLHWTWFSLLLDLLVLVEQFVPSLRTQRNWRQGTSKEHCSDFTDSQIQWMHLEAGFGSARRVRRIARYNKLGCTCGNKGSKKAWLVSAIFYYLVKLRSRHPGSFICVLIPEEDDILLISTKLPWSGQRAFHQNFWQKCQYRFVLVNEFHPAKWDTSNTIATYRKQPNLERASSTPVWLWQCPDSPNIEIALLMSTSSSS